MIVTLDGLQRMNETGFYVPWSHNLHQSMNLLETTSGELTTARALLGDMDYIARLDEIRARLGLPGRLS